MTLVLVLVRRRLFVAAGRGPPRRAPARGAPATPALSPPQPRGQPRAAAHRPDSDDPDTPAARRTTPAGAEKGGEPCRETPSTYRGA